MSRVRVIVVSPGPVMRRGSSNPPDWSVLEEDDEEDEEVRYRVLEDVWATVLDVVCPTVEEVD
jgi:hypothetical protein